MDSLALAVLITHQCMVFSATSYNKVQLHMSLHSHLDSKHLWHYVTTIKE